MVSKETPNADGQTCGSPHSQAVGHRRWQHRERETSFLITADNSLPFRKVSNQSLTQSHSTASWFTATFYYEAAGKLLWCAHVSCIIRRIRDIIERQFFTLPGLFSSSYPSSDKSFMPNLKQEGYISLACFRHYSRMKRVSFKAGA